MAVTKFMIEAAWRAFINAHDDPIEKIAGPDALAAITRALEAAEKAAWRPISEWDGKRGFAIVADCFGSQPAEFDPDPTLEEFLSICDEGEGPEDFPAYLVEYPGEGWRTTTADEVEFLEPTMFRPIPEAP